MSTAFQISLVDWSKLILLSCLWGASFLFMEVALRELGVFTVVLSRVGLAALGLNLWIALKGQTLFHYKAHWKHFFFMGFIGNAIPFSLIVWGQIYITGSLSAILNATLPFFTLILTHLFTADEKMTPVRIAALMIGFMGVTIIIGPGAIAPETDIFVLMGEGAVLLAVMCYSVIVTYGRRFSRLKVPSIVAATGQLTAAAILILPLALFFERPWTIESLGLPVIGAIIGGGLLSSAFAFVLWYHLLSRIGSNNVSLVAFMIPVSAIALGGFFLGETLTGNQIIGMLILGLGLILIDGRLWARFSPVFQTTQK